VRRGAECAGGARADAEAAFTSSSVTSVAVRVDDAHGENVLRILIGMLADIEDLEFAFRKIANRIMVFVSRYHIEHHLAGGDMEDQWDVGLSGGRRFLRGHREEERRDEAGHTEKKVVVAFLAGHGHHCIAGGERWGRENRKDAFAAGKRVSSTAVRGEVSDGLATWGRRDFRWIDYYL
jgi:hypothetical protein